MAAKLKDVAGHAGVSMATVSRILNADKTLSVSRETEEKVWKAVQELGYKSNKGLSSASGKSNKNTKTVGYILQVTKEKFEDSFFSKIIYGIDQEIIAQRLSLKFAYTVFDLEDPVIWHNVLHSEVDGLVFIGEIPAPFYDALVKQIPHCVATFLVPDDNPIDCITVDYEPVYKLVRSMIKAGHTDIAFIGGGNYQHSPENTREGTFFNQEARFQCYLKALFENGIPIRPEIIKDGKWDIEIAYHKMTEILESGSKITAVFAAGDRMAIGAMRAIQEKGLKIPGDISIASFDDIEMASYLNPPLTTVYYPKEEIGRLAVNVLIENMQKEERNQLPRKILLPSQIVERASFKPITS
jgi:LacI family transcriptional regulator